MGGRLRPLRPSLCVLFACALLGGCQTEGLQVADSNLSRSAVALDGSATSTSIAPVTGKAQAYSPTEESKVEASVSAVASGFPRTSRKEFDLFKTLDDDNDRAAKSRAVTGRVLVAKTGVRPPRDVARRKSAMSVLPGVRTQTADAVRGLGTLGRSASRKAQTLSEPVRLASAAALARISRHGLRTQHSKVSVGCLKPDLVRMIKRAERHFGRHAVVTSGYRSPRHNRRVGGARRSMHVTCKAADVQIKGVAKSKLASWFRKQSGRGGVGTYCHTASVHIDVGEKRDWNWRCKRHRGKRRKS